MSHTGIRVFTVSALHADGYAVSSAVSSGAMADVVVVVCFG